MRRPRRNHSSAFKARIAREAIQGLKTVAEIAGDNEIHVSQVSAWKKEFEANMALLFERTNAVDDARDSLERKCAILERKVGQLVIEKEYLEKSASSWGSINEPYRQKQFPISSTSGDIYSLLGGDRTIERSMGCRKPARGRRCVPR